MKTVFIPALLLASLTSATASASQTPLVMECTEATVGEACGPIISDEFWGPRSGTCMIDLWSDPADKKYACVYGG